MILKDPSFPDLPIVKEFGTIMGAKALFLFKCVITRRRNMETGNDLRSVGGGYFVTAEGYLFTPQRRTIKGMISHGIRKARINGKYRRMDVLVWQGFHQTARAIPSKWIKHRDGDETNCAIDNLIWDGPIPYDYFHYAIEAVPTALLQRENGGNVPVKHFWNIQTIKPWFEPKYTYADIVTVLKQRRPIYHGYELRLMRPLETSMYHAQVQDAIDKFNQNQRMLKEHQKALNKQIKKNDDLLEGGDF